MTTERESDANSGVDYEAFLEAQWKDIKEFMNQSAENYETDTKKEQSYIPMLEVCGCMHALYVCMYVRKYECTQVCMYVCM